MNLTAYDVALIAGGFTIAGVLLGSFLTYRFALRLSGTTARKDAGRKLREAFAPEIAALNPVTGNGVKNVEAFLREAWPKHHAAVYELAFHLPENERAALEQAWKSYYEQGRSIRFYDYYQGERPREIFAERVNAILKFTQV